MSVKKFMARLAKSDNAIKREYNPFSNVLRSSSPGVNFLFGNTHGLPLGFSLLLWGPDKSGKSFLAYDFIAQIHQNEPEAIVVRYDTEFRERGQMTRSKLEAFGIDPDRLHTEETNTPEGVFDHITNEIVAMCQDGAKIRAIVIDSISNILGRRAMNAEGVNTQQRGDKAATLQEGLGRIWGVISKYNIALIVTAQARAEQDPLEVMRGNTIRMDGAFFLKHFGGYVMMVEPNKSKSGREGLDGQKFENEELKDGLGKAERTGHKIRATMKGSSYGPRMRSIEYTVDYQRGIINQHEEIFTLGVERRIVNRPNNVTYELTDYPVKGESTTWRGKVDFLNALKVNENLRAEILERLRSQDIDLMNNGAASRYYNADETKDDVEGVEV